MSRSSAPRALPAAVVVCAVALASAVAATAIAPPARAQARIPGEIVVIARGDAGPGIALDATGNTSAQEPRIASILSRYGFTHARQLGPARGRGERALVLTSARADFDADLAVRELLESGAARAAAPNQTLRYDVVPNDPYLAPKQWHLSTSAAGIRAQNAWGLGTGDSSVVIAIMDSGVDRTHPDLAAKIWRNPGEIPGNSIDDDGNGYVDDVNGWDFADHDNDPNPALTIPPAVGYDTGFHGTFIAGLAAAATNNALGMAGVDWKGKIMPLKVAGADGSISLASVTEAFQYIFVKHPGVLNISFGGTDASLPAYFQALVNDAIAADIVCVASAGNDGNDLGHYPAACESVLAVAATTAANVRASYSCWGWYVDIAAPGDALWSSIPTNYAYDSSSQFIFALAFGWDGINPYMNNSGTSFAAPVVAGACALVRAKYPLAPATAVMKHVVETADVVSYDNDIGGRMNVYAALLNTIDAPGAGSSAAGTAFALRAAAPNPLRDQSSVELELPAAARVRLAVFDPRGRFVRELIDGELLAGPHIVVWDGTDARGSRVAPGLYFLRAEQGGEVRATRVTVLAP